MKQKKWDLAHYEFPIEDANRLLEPGYLPIESGYKLLSNGQYHVCALTPMPRCKGKMIHWWFGWIGDTERYKLWHPHDHVLGEWEGKREPDQYIGASHIAHEYIGGEMAKLKITFCEPSEFMDTSRFAALGVTAVSARVYLLEMPDMQVATLIHFIRDTDFGCEMRSQFWIHVPGADDIARGNHQHCIEEMGNLATFLPELYAKETARK
ncbi:MAG: hypothetical protein ABSB79_16355 [Syntrophales bacterium]|jgi:hypothetical protein